MNDDPNSRPPIHHSMADPASPPCFAHEIQDSPFGWSANPEEVAANVARWRRGERKRLLEARMAIPAEQRRDSAQQVAKSLDHLLDRHIHASAKTIISVYWPFRGELNLRGWMADAHERGYRIALPIVQSKAQPLQFRQWTPDGRLVPGVWRIPIPADGELLTPTVVIAPLIGIDTQGYRLGYGGGFFDRTLASLAEQSHLPLVIGVGQSIARIRTIYPQAHDVPMHWVITDNESTCINAHSADSNGTT